MAAAASLYADRSDGRNYTDADRGSPTTDFHRGRMIYGHLNAHSISTMLTDVTGRGHRAAPADQGPSRAGQRAILDCHQRGQRLHLARSRPAPGSRAGAGKRRLWLPAAAVVPGRPGQLHRARPCKSGRSDSAHPVTATVCILAILIRASVCWSGRGTDHGTRQRRLAPTF